jgi:hypothetical protein
MVLRFIFACWVAALMTGCADFQSSAQSPREGVDSGAEAGPSRAERVDEDDPDAAPIDAGTDAVDERGRLDDGRRLE